MLFIEVNEEFMVEVGETSRNHQVEGWDWHEANSYLEFYMQHGWMWK